MSNKTLLNALGIPSTPTPAPPPSPSVTNTSNQLVSSSTNTAIALVTSPPDISVSDEEMDFRQSRKTIKMMIEQGSLVLDKLKETADDTNGARFYEVYEKMFTSLAGVTEKLIDIHNKKREKEKLGRVPEKNSVQIDKAVFVGSTTDLLDKLGEKDR